MKKHRLRTQPPRRKKQSTAQTIPRVVVSTTGYFHGGKPGLPVGSYILPAALVGETREDLLEHLDNAGVAENGYYQPTKFCSVTTDLDWATVYASYHLSRSGVVYEVEPIGDVTEDREGELYGVPWFKCERARIVRVVNIPFQKMHKLRQRHARGESLGTGCIADWLFLASA